MKQLSIVIVSYQCIDSLLRCLEALNCEAVANPDWERDVQIIVVDAGSDDGTAETVRVEFPAVMVLPQNENVGFARGCNIGIANSVGRRIVLLNPDTVVSPGALAELCAYLDAHPEVAAVGPRLSDAHSDAQAPLQAFPTLRREIASQWMPLVSRLGFDEPALPYPKHATAVDWICGACFLLSRDALREIGTLDERFFLYFEETDWCRRAWAAGWQIHHLPTVSVEHTGGVSAAASSEPLAGGQVRRFYLRSRRRYFHKHYGPATALAVEAVYGIRAIVRNAKHLRFLGRKWLVQ